MSLYKIILLFFAGVFFSLNSLAQISHGNDTTMDKSVDLVGEIKRADLQKGDFAKYFMQEYEIYSACPNEINNLKNYIYSTSIVIVLATWCHDSKTQVPRFYKILDNLNYKTGEIKIIGVDRDKTGGNFDISLLEIEKVPTFIFYKGDKEIGRIVETPETSLEKDSFLILSN